MLLEIILTVLTVYLVIAVFVFWMLTNNIFLWRSRNYEIPFGLTEGTQTKGWLEEGIRYWKCDNPQQVDDRWVVLLHSWGRNAARMVERGAIYWERGYSIVLIDAWSHGQSKYKYTTTALWYAEHAKKICEKEGIEKPIVHGLSFGAIAATIYASRYPVQGLVAEALMNNVKDMMYGFLKVLNIPVFLFAWEIHLLLRMNFPWNEVEPYLNLPKISTPIFLIHGEVDEMFPVDLHFRKNLQYLKSTDMHWTVPGSPHSKMARHPEYKKYLNSFLDDVE